MPFKFLDNLLDYVAENLQAIITAEELIPTIDGIPQPQLVELRSDRDAIINAGYHSPAHDNHVGEVPRVGLVTVRTRKYFFSGDPRTQG